jgi:hypothetical protein
VAPGDHQAFHVSIRAEVAMDAPRVLKRRPIEGTARIDEGITISGAYTNLPAFATIETHSPGAKSDMPATSEATKTARAGESAPPKQHSMHGIQRGHVTRVAESALPSFRTGLRSVLTLPRRAPAGVLVVPLALLLFLLTLTADSITALAVVPLWVLLPPLVLLLLLLVFAQHGRLTVRTAVPVWTLLIPVTLLLLLLGLTRAGAAGGHPSDHRAAALGSSQAFAMVTHRTPPSGQARALLRDQPRLRQVQRDG